MFKSQCESKNEREGKERSRADDGACGITDMDMDKFFDLVTMNDRSQEAVGLKEKGLHLTFSCRCWGTGAE